MGAFADLCLNCSSFIVTSSCENVKEIVQAKHHTDLKTAYLESLFTALYLMLMLCKNLCGAQVKQSIESGLAIRSVFSMGPFI